MNFHHLWMSQAWQNRQVHLVGWLWQAAKDVLLYRFQNKVLPAWELNFEKSISFLAKVWGWVVILFECRKTMFYLYDNSILTKVSVF